VPVQGENPSTLLSYNTYCTVQVVVIQLFKKCLVIGTTITINNNINLSLKDNNTVTLLAFTNFHKEMGSKFNQAKFSQYSHCAMMS
jgi:hypothetical protein